MPTRMLNNIENTVKDDLKAVIKKGSKISVAASYFSIYAYRELKKQLDGVAEFRFIFTAPTFIKEKAEKQKLFRRNNKSNQRRQVKTNGNRLPLTLTRTLRECERSC